MVSTKLLLSVFCTFCLDVLKTIIAKISQMTRGDSSSSSSSSSESDEDVPIARLKPPRRREIDDLSGDEDDIPLSVIGKKAMQSILPSQSSHDEDNNKDEDQEKEEEEGGERSDTEEPWGGVVEEDILPPKLKLVWDGGKIVRCIDSSTGSRIWRCDHCKNKWSGWNHTKVLGHAIWGEGYQGLQEYAS